MKPLIVFKFGAFEPERAKEFDYYIQRLVNDGCLKDYDVIILWGDGDVNVYYPFKPLSFYYNKIKAWVILKIWKNRKF